MDTRHKLLLAREGFGVPENDEDARPQAEQSRILQTMVFGILLVMSLRNKTQDPCVYTILY